VATIAIGAYACLVFNLVGVNLLFSSLHSYAGL
jgi:ABC-type transport system involved in cytochrome c biogenesis permease subunit